MGDHFQLAVPSCVDLNKALPPEKRTNQMWQTHGVSGTDYVHQHRSIDKRVMIFFCDW